MTITERVDAALATVLDPELPAVRIVDLGVVESVSITDETVAIELLPTFSGCPALDVIRDDVERAVTGIAEGRSVHVTFRRDIAWTTDRMNEQARAALSGFGVAPPGARTLPLIVAGVPCPYCGSTDTIREAEFGPTLCRDIRYCNTCRNPFEGFKPK